MSKWSSAFRDSRWQELRLKVMERDLWCCHCCGESGVGVTLNVHHSFYETGKAPWEYDTDTLFTVCECCHKVIHDCQKELMVKILSSSCQGGSAVGIFETIQGFLDAMYQGPSFKNSAKYADGYYRGSIIVEESDAIKLCRSAGLGLGEVSHV